MAAASSAVATQKDSFLASLFGGRAVRAVLTAIGAAALAALLLRLLRRMRDSQAAPKELAAATTEVEEAADSSGLRRIPMSEVAQHTSDQDCWIVYKGKVYDATKYLPDHPGGAQVILECAGKDATVDFDEVGHSDDAVKELEGMCIGVVGKAGAPAAAPAAAPPAASHQGLITLQGPHDKVMLKLVEKVALSHNVRRFRFALPSPKHRLGLPIGKHLTLSYDDEDGKMVSRAYTPVTGDEVEGYVDLVIKIYFANEHPKFPKGGKLSQYVESLKIGDSIGVKGPTGRWEYLGRSRFSYHKEPMRMATKYNMIAGGTGITPMLQVLYAMLRDSGDGSQVALLFANQSPDDIILRDEIDRLAAKHPTQFRCWYTVDKVPEGSGKWNYSTGFIDEEMCRTRLFPPGNDTITLLCGPPPMIKYACQPNLEKCGHGKDSIFSF
eukprot:TRINITY_DN2451_c1_g1_i1.p2 TRINITY_DN2451_c1_g1~~TRINITY_DN2451_c1_g1_i1.p2  ORF type:complete len:439 (+),score=167.94 TRINITY_DN2451_c1_g1_i1:73-1389(+)